MPGLNGDVRDDVLREARQKINRLAAEGRSVEEIEQRMNGHRKFSEAERGLVELLVHHAVAEAKGSFFTGAT